MRLFALIGGLIVLVLVAALAVPPLVDWSTFRAEFERQASRALGQPVAVRGDTSLRLLPLPRVLFETVAVGGDGEGALLSADRFEVTMELAPLLTGQVRIVDMALIGGDLTLQLREDGSLDWFESAGSSVPVDAGQVSIERLSIRDSRISVLRTNGASPLNLQDVDLELTARRLSGPWRGEGEFGLNGEQYRVTASTGAFRETTDARELSARLTVRPRSLPFDVTVAGPVRLTGSTVSARGTFSVDPSGAVLPTMSAEEAAFAEARPSDGLPVRAEGTFELTPDALAIGDLNVNVGAGDDPYRVTGTGRIDLTAEPRFTLELEGSRIDADQLATAQTTEVGERSAAARLAALRTVLTRIPRPRLPGRVTLYLPAVAVGDTLIREVDLAAEPDADVDRWDVKRLEAILPGRTTLEASGSVTVGDRGADSDAGIGFDGDVLVASRQPSGLARWLGGDERADDAIRRLRSAGVSGRLQLGEGRARLDGMELRLGADVLRGTVARVAGLNGARPMLLAELAGNGLQADPALALFSLLTRSSVDEAATTHDVDLRLAVQQLNWRRVDARDVDAVLAYRAQGLTVDRLDVGSVAGLAIEGSGRLDDPYGRPSGQMSGTVRVTDAAALNDMVRRNVDVPSVLAHLVRDSVLLRGTELTGTLEARPEGVGSSVTVNVAGTVGTSEVEAAVSLEGEFAKVDELALDATVQARSDEARGLIALLGLNAGAGDTGVRGRLLLRGSGELGAVLDAGASLGVGDSEMAFDGAVSPGEGTAAGRLNVSGEDVSVLLDAFGLGFTGTDQPIPAQVSGRMKLTRDGLRMDELKATVRAATLNGELAVDRTTRPRASVSGRLALDAVDLEGLIELVIGPGSAIADVRGDDTPLGSPWLAGYDGEIAFEAGEASLDLGLFGAEPASGLEGRLLLYDGSLALVVKEARWLSGSLEGRVDIGRGQGTATFATAVRLRDGDLARTGLFDAERPAVSGRFDLEVDAEGQGVTRAAIVSRLSGGGVLAVRDARLAGLRADALNDLEAAADRMEDNALEASAGALFERSALTGAVGYDRVEVPFGIAAGTLRTGGIDLSTGALAASATARVDLVSGVLNGQLRGRFATEEGAPQGVSPAFTIAFGGTLEEPSASVDPTATATYLTTRLRERREREFAAQRAAILERQRLARETRLIVLRDRARQRALEEADRARLDALEAEPQDAL